MLDELEMRKQKLKDRIASLNLEREEIGKSMDSAEKSLQEIVGCTDWDTTRFFIEEDRMEKSGKKFMHKVRLGYLEIQKRNPNSSLMFTLSLLILCKSISKTSSFAARGPTTL